jgi:hypothetical protein
MDAPFQVDPMQGVPVAVLLPGRAAVADVVQGVREQGNGEMRIIVCGGRNFFDYGKLDAVMQKIKQEVPHDTLIVIQGGATGADAMARQWCATNHVCYDNYPAEWRKHGNAAGPIRNQKMLDKGKPDLVIAFAGGKGTADMVRRAEAAGIPVEQIK